jgi:Transposase IS116/IS110/IS902 family
MVAEIGDISRFPTPQALCSWAGLTPKHRESDTKVRRGRLTKQGSKLVRWAAIEAVSNGRGPKFKQDFQRLAERRPRTWPEPRWPANFSSWSITPCVTGRSAAWPKAKGPDDPAGHSQGARSANGMTPTSVATSTK